MRERTINWRNVVMLVTVGIAMLFVGLFSGQANAMGGRSNETDKAQSLATEKMVKEANNRLGLPNITRFQEKKFQKLIYELRDREVKTYSYFMDMTGRLHFLCESIGYGLPASVQYVNPDKSLWGGNGASHTVSQPEPNGLFMPDSLDATYVLCTDSKGKLKPVYSEPKLIVSPFRLKNVRDLRQDDKVAKIKNNANIGTKESI